MAEPSLFIPVRRRAIHSHVAERSEERILIRTDYHSFQLHSELLLGFFQFNFLSTKMSLSLLGVATIVCWRNCLDRGDFVV